MAAGYARRALRFHFSIASATDTLSGGSDTLARRLFALIIPKRSAVVAIQKWKEEGHSVRKYELNRLVRQLRKYKRYKHALEICEWMRIQEDMELQPGDYAVHLDLITKIRGLSGAEAFFEDIPRRMRGHQACSALLHSYVRHKESEKAESLIKRMSECGFLTYPIPFNHMLTLYISTGQHQKVPHLIQDLKKKTDPDTVTYNLWMNAHSAQNDLDSVEKVFLELKRSTLEPDWVTYSILANLYIKLSLPEKATSMLNEMGRIVSSKQRVAFSSLLSLHTNIRDRDGLERTWSRMKSCFSKMSDAEYTCMISSLVKLGSVEGAENLYYEWESVSPTRDSRVPNILLAGYIDQGRIEAAESLYARMVERGIPPSYTTHELLTWGYLKLRRMDKAMDCFRRAVASVKKWVPNERLICEVLANLEEEGCIHGSEQFLIVLRKVGAVSTEVYNSLLRTYARASKMPLIVVERMKKDNVEPDEETQRLIRLTSRMCVTQDSSDFIIEGHV